MEINMIKNKKLKEDILDSSLAVLMNNNLLNKSEFAYLEAQFGYLFQREDGFIESLYKIIKRSGEVFYMALQENVIKQLNIDESLFKSIVDTMKELLS